METFNILYIIYTTVFNKVRIIFRYIAIWHGQFLSYSAQSLKNRKIKANIRV